MNEIEISIIIPVYNVEKYIKRCLESVINQTFQQFEAIIIDDGSTDMSSVICDEYKEKDIRLKVIHTENAGLSVARNKGLDLCRGKYICFVDSDDSLTENFLQFFYEKINGSDYDFVSCCANFINDQDEVIRRNLYECDRASIEDDIFEWYMRTNYIEDAVWNKIYRRELFEGLRFEPGIIFEDSELIVKLLKRCQKILFTREYNYNYRIREDSILGYRNGSIEKDFRKNKMDLFKVYESSVLELRGTKWEKIYHKRILLTCSEYWELCGTLEESERQETREIIKDYYKRYRYRLWDRELFGLKEIIYIVLKIQFPLFFRIIKGNR